VVSQTAASSIKKQDSVGLASVSPNNNDSHVKPQMVVPNHESGNEYDADEFEKDDLVQMAEPTTKTHR
jgi:hypothetical protein